MFVLKKAFSRNNVLYYLVGNAKKHDKQANPDKPNKHVKPKKPVDPTNTLFTKTPSTDPQNYISTFQTNFNQEELKKQILNERQRLKKTIDLETKLIHIFQQMNNQKKSQRQIKNIKKQAQTLFNQKQNMQNPYLIFDPMKLLLKSMKLSSIISTLGLIMFGIFKKWYYVGFWLSCVSIPAFYLNSFFLTGYILGSWIVKQALKLNISTTQLSDMGVYMKDTPKIYEYQAYAKGLYTFIVLYTINCLSTAPYFYILLGGLQFTAIALLFYDYKNIFSSLDFTFDAHRQFFLLLLLYCLFLTFPLIFIMEDLSFSKFQWIPKVKKEAKKVKEYYVNKNFEIFNAQKINQIDQKQTKQTHQDKII